MNVNEILKPIERLRKVGARVHCVSNTVAQNFTSNVLLSCGATPSMTTSKEEISDFVANADALLLNLGTLDFERREVCYLAAKAAQANNIPFVLDPVMCDISSTRLEFAKRLLTFPPNILRVNKSEAAVLEEEIAEVSKSCCVAMTGEDDVMLTGAGTTTIHNGHPLMGKLIAVGCAQGAVIAALASVADKYSDAILATLLWFGVAGEIAAEKSGGPGSFNTAFIDELHNIEIATIAERARLD